MLIDKVWELCMRLWDDIYDKPGLVCENKETWMEENDFEGVLNDCFFCQFAYDEHSKPENHGYMCDFCPGVLVDPKFDCTNFEYNYANNPKEFRRRLHQLNKKRTGSKV